MKTQRESLSRLLPACLLVLSVALAACQDTLVSNTAEDLGPQSSLTAQGNAPTASKSGDVRLKKVDKSNVLRIPGGAASLNRQNRRVKDGEVTPYTTGCPITDPNYPACDEDSGPPGGGGGGEPAPLNIEGASFLTFWSLYETSTGSYTAASRTVPYILTASCFYVDNAPYGCFGVDHNNATAAQLTASFEDNGMHHYRTNSTHRADNTSIGGGTTTFNTFAEGDG